MEHRFDHRAASSSAGLIVREPRRLERFAVVGLLRRQDCHIVLDDPCELSVAEKFYNKLPRVNLFHNQ